MEEFVPFRKSRGCLAIWAADSSACISDDGEAVLVGSHLALAQRRGRPWR